MVSLENIKIFTPLQKLPKNVGDFDKLIVAKGFKKLSKVQKIARSGHTDHSFSIQHPKEMEILFLVKAIHTETFSLFS